MNGVALPTAWLVDVISSVGFSVLATAATGWVMRTWLGERLKAAIQNEYNQKLESYKAQLQAVNSMELEVLKAQLQGQSAIAQEQLRSQLQIDAAQRNLVFSTLHEKRFNAIDAVYQSLLALHDAVSFYIQANKLSDDLTALADVEKAFEAFNLAFTRKQLLIPQDIIDGLYSLQMAFIGMTYRTTHIKSQPLTQNTIAKLDQVILDFKTKVLGLMNQTSTNMRVAIGDNDQR